MTEKSGPRRRRHRRAPAGSGWGAPDSWGVWFPDDPDRCRGSASGRGQRVRVRVDRAGPYGYLPTDPARLADELGARGLKVSAGVFEHLHRPDSWDAVWDQVKDVAALTKATGGTHVVVIPGMFRDEKTGADIEPRRLTPEAWEAKTTGVERLGRAVQEEYGLSIAYHLHAESRRVPGRHRTVPRRHRSRLRAALPGHRARQLLPRGQPAPHPHLPGADRIPAPSRSTPRSSTACSPRTSSGPRRCGWGR